MKPYVKVSRFSDDFGDLGQQGGSEGKRADGLAREGNLTFDVLERGVCHIIAILPYCCELWSYIAILGAEISIFWCRRHQLNVAKTW